MVLMKLYTNISIANSSKTIIGKGTRFTTDLKIGDEIQFTNDSYTSTRTAIIQNITSELKIQQTPSVQQYHLQLVTRRRAKLQNQVKIFYYLKWL